MDEYRQLNTFDLVYLSDVDTDTYEVYDTIWAYKIKLDGTSDRKLDKLNPRWCLVGTPMDRDLRGRRRSVPWRNRGRRTLELREKATLPRRGRLLRRTLHVVRRA